MTDYDDKDFNVLDHENEMIENFADKYLVDAVRIINTRVTTSRDRELIYDAICIATALYMKKLRDGEINKDRTLH